MKKILILFFGLIIGTGFINDAMATHMAGGSIRYDYVGPTPGSTTSWRYKITVFIARFCNTQGSATYSCVGAGEEIYAECTQSGTRIGPITLTAVPYVPKPGDRSNARGARDVSDVCPSRQSACEIAGGVSGYEMFAWEGFIDLPRCNSWRIVSESCTCCRNPTRNYPGAGGAETALEVFINTSWSPRSTPGGAPANSAPQFADEAKPFPSVCVGQDVFYGVGTYDADGDSLRFETCCPWSTVASAGFPNLSRLTPTNGATCANPIPPSFILDAATGLMSFTPATAGAYIVAFYVNEYERCTGILKGKTYREVQFIVGTCNNSVPEDISGISNITGSAIQLSTYKMEICNGDVITWDDTLRDPDITDSIYVKTNLTRVLPNAKMDIIPIGAKNSIVVRFTWRAVMGIDPVKSFFISFTDNNCDIPGSGFSVFQLDVKPSAALDPDLYVCKGDTAFMQGYGSNTFRWTSLYGDPLTPGVNWFPDTTPGVDTNRTARFVPTQTSAIAIEVPNVRGLCGEIVQNCFVRDTIIVHVPEAYQITMPSDTVICNPATGLLDVTPSKANLKYTYKWGPNSKLDNDTLKTPTFSGVLKKTEFMVTVTSDSGCVREGSINVAVTNPFPQNMMARATDTIICLQDTIDMWVNTGSINYSACDTSIYPCLGVSDSKTFGPGATRNVSNSNTHPTIYSSRNRSVKVQFLYTAADLRLRGIPAGPINSLGFEILQIGNHGANPFNGFTIKMGCTSIAKLGSTFIGKLKTVSDAKAHIPSLGWNTHAFDREYIWDGISNLLVEICWDNGTNVYNWDHIMSFDVTAYDAANRYYSRTANGGCTATFPTGNAMRYLPRTQFGVCSGIDQANYSFQWVTDPSTSNGGFIANTNADSTKASVDLTTAKNYKVLVADTSGACYDTLDLKIDVVIKYKTKPDTLPLQCITGGVIKLTAPTPTGISKPGGKWTGAGIVNDTLGYWNPAVSGSGSFPVTYTITGDVCASSGTTILNIAGKPDPSLLSPDSACSLYSNNPAHALVPKIPGGYFSGNGIDSIITVVPASRNYHIDGTKFNPTSTKPDTAYVNYKVFLGCWNDTTIKIPVVAPFDTTYLGVLYNGVPIKTTQFCSTSRKDTLAVLGKGGVWSVITDPMRPSTIANSRAMLDTLRGVFDPKIINGGSGGKEFIQISRAGFCGDTGRFEVDIFQAPEVQILAENFCFKAPGDCIDSEIPPADRKKLIKVRVAKSPFKTIDLSMPNTFVDVVTADKLSSGWNNLIESDNVTKWDGNPWMIFPYKCQYSFCQLTEGRYPISYTMALKYRAVSGHPDSICAFTHDTAFYVSKTPEPPSLTDSIYRICLGDSIPEMEFEEFDSKLTLEWFADNLDQDPANAVSKENPITSDTSFARYVPTEGESFYGRLRDAAGCLSRAKSIEFSVHNIPLVQFQRSVDTLIVGEEVRYTNTTDYEDLPINFQWKYGTADIGLSESDFIFLEKPTTSPWYALPSTEHNPLVIQANDYGIELVRLIGINEIGCEDSIQYALYVDQLVNPVFPNVFTPNGDRINDWWSAISPKEFGDYNQALLLEAYKDQFLEITGYIYDRWGRKVQELSIDNPFWTGENADGNPQPDGVYMYTIEMKIKSISEDVFKEQGTITLIRGK